MVYVFPALVTPYVKIRAFFPSRKSCSWLLTVCSKSSGCVTSGPKIYKIKEQKNPQNKTLRMW